MAVHDARPGRAGHSTGARSPGFTDDARAALAVVVAAVIALAIRTSRRVRRVGSSS
ncbi:hypothetical protein BH10ACT1_BH10ACT1_18950 [soil metagenome]